jgi:hypothetical protein
MTDNVMNAGQPTMGPSGPPVENVSGQVPTVGATARPPQPRNAFGRYRRRGHTLVRGLDAPGTERTELLRDAVTGQAIRGRNNAVLFRHNAFDMEQVHYTSPDFSGHPPLSAILDDGSYPRHLRREVR